MIKLFFFILLILPFLSNAQEFAFPMNGNWNDSTGNHNGIAKNGATFSTTTKQEGVASGNFNVAYSNRIITEDKVDIPSGPVTILGSIYPTAASGTCVILSNTSTGYIASVVVFYDATTQRISVGVRDGTDLQYAYGVAGSVPRNTWSHFAVRAMDANGQYWKTFINGVQVGTDTTAQAGGGANDTISIGSFRYGSYPFNGYIDNISLFKSALSAPQILYAYNNRSSYYGGCPAMSGGL